MLVWNNESAAVAVGNRVSPQRWWDGFGEVMDRIGSRLARYEPRRHAAALMRLGSDAGDSLVADSAPTAVLTIRQGSRCG